MGHGAGPVALPPRNPVSLHRSQSLVSLRVLSRACFSATGRCRWQLLIRRWPARARDVVASTPRRGRCVDELGTACIASSSLSSFFCASFHLVLVLFADAISSHDTGTGLYQTPGAFPASMITVPAIPQLMLKISSTLATISVCTLHPTPGSLLFQCLSP